MLLPAKKTYLLITSLSTKTKKKEKNNKTTQSVYFSILGERAVTVQALCCPCPPQAASDQLSEEV